MSMRENTWMSFISHGWGNGYIHLPKGHPWYGMHYDHIPADVHGGLTFSEEEDGYWVIGFDTGHYGDTLENCPEEYVAAQTSFLLQQALAATKLLPAAE